MIEAGANVNARDKNNQTPIHGAAQRSDAMKVVKKLLNTKTIEYATQDKNGDTPLHLASRYGYKGEYASLEAIKALIERGADVNARNNTNQTPLHNAAKAGNTEVIEELLKGGAIIDAQEIESNTALHIAAEYNKIEIVQIFINCRANLNVNNNRGYTPLDRAIHLGHTDIARLLQDHGGQESRRCSTM